MSDVNDELGEISLGNGYVEARLTRSVEHDQQAVWKALTDPARLVEWLAPGTIDTRVGGAAKLNFTDSGTVIDSRVTACDAPALLEYSWSSPGEPLRPVRWETLPTAGGTQLVLTLRVPAAEDIGRSCAGWEAHLMMLLAALEGVPIKFPFDRFTAMRAAYKAKLAG